MRLTKPTERVLRVFLEDVHARQYGYELMKAAGIKSGTLYPMLGRLEEEGLVTADWESVDELEPGRPGRRYYRLTGDGVRLARQLLAEASFAEMGQRRTARGRPATGGQPA